MIARLRRWLLTGLLVLVPLTITWLILEGFVSFMDQSLRYLPDVINPETYLGHRLPGLGMVLVLVILLLVGAVAGNFLGIQFVKAATNLVNHIPVIRNIYGGIKQISDPLFSEKGMAFREAVLVQWPREGVWTIGFVTGEPPKEMMPAQTDATAADWISVFIPTAPMPSSGYLMFFRKEDCRHLHASVEESLTYVISMGVAVPNNKQPPPKPS